jgi:hypothetical protein
MLQRSVILIKKKKFKFFYVEDLYSKYSFPSFLASSELGLNTLRVVFPRSEPLNQYLFYAPIHKTLVVSISMLVKQVKLFLKGLSQGFFFEFRIFGLGFKVKRSGDFGLRFIKFDIGFSHFIKFPLCKLVRIYRIKKRFLLFSIDYETIQIVLKQIRNVRKHNPYKVRGLKLTGGKYRVKSGKKQTKR